MLTYTRPLANVIHVQAETQYELCATFIRPQEFYESSFDEIRGVYGLTVEDIAKVYRKRGVEFDYFSKWNGFNFPGRLWTEWASQSVLPGWSQQEQRLNRVIMHAHRHGVSQHYYVIGTHREREIDHELAHALWHLEPGYRRGAYARLADLRKNNAWTTELLTQFLKDRGYADTVVDDEMHAYLSEADLGYWKKKMGPVPGEFVYRAGATFREHLQNWLGKEQVNV